ncbi:hypothetical protein KR222_011150, partial [Zaprionus bogoriensis]
AIAGSRWEGGSKEYCLIATLDVKNAFNSAKWSGILRALENFRVPPYLIRMVRSYFSGRVLRYDTDDGLRTHDVTLGVP